MARESWVGKNRDNTIQKSENCSLCNFAAREILNDKKVIWHNGDAMQYDA